MKTSVLFALCALLTGCRSTPEISEARTAGSQAKEQEIRAPKDPSADWLKGELTRLDDGTTLEFRIERKLARRGLVKGGVAAINAASGERFAGQYSAVVAFTGGTGRVLTPSGTALNVQMNPQASSANAVAMLLELRVHPS